MIKKSKFLIFFFILFFASCSKEYDCADLQIQPVLIKFNIQDIDTIILRKYKANDNYQTLVDTVAIQYGVNGQYYISGDTAIVFISDGKNGIKTGYDWQLFIPAKNKTVTVSGIISEKKTGKCGSGIFSMDKFGCNCTNKIFSAKQDNQLINFSTSDTAKHYLYIR